MNICKHVNRRFLYSNSIREIGHACNLMVCVSCGATVQDCDYNKEVSK